MAYSRQTSSHSAGDTILDDHLDVEFDYIYNTILNEGIGTSELKDAEVTNAKIATDAINGAKIADDAIDSEHYTDGSIDTAHLANDAVTAVKIANIDPDTLTFTDNPAEQSVTFANGFIFKAGYIAYAASSAITFGTAFPNAVLSVSVSGVNASAVTCNAVTTQASKTGFTIKDNDSKAGHYWQAWGR